MLPYIGRYNAQRSFHAPFLSLCSSRPGWICRRAGRLRQLGRHHLAGCRGGWCQRTADRRLDDRAGDRDGGQHAGAFLVVQSAGADRLVNAGAALLATSLHGVTLPETIGVFIFANALILLCGITGLFARLMRLIPHSLAAAMLAGVLLQFGLHAFAHLEGHFLLCGSMIAAWLIAKALAPRYAIVVTLLVGGIVAWAGGDVVTDKLTLSLVMPEFIAPTFTFTSLVSIGVPFFLVTMASQNAPGFATMKASGYPLAVSPLIIVTGALALLLSPFGVFSICIAAITAAICQSPDAHPDAGKRWLAAIAAGGFYLLAGIFGGSITGLMAALPLSWIQTLAGLALLGTISGSLYQALSHEAERDAAIVTFLMTASGVTILGIGSAFWGLVLGGVCYALFSRARRA